MDQAVPMRELDNPTQKLILMVETKEFTRLNITSVSGKAFQLTISVKTISSDRGIHAYCEFLAFNVGVKIDTVQGSKCVVVEPQNVKMSTLESVFGKMNPKARACIRISDEFVNTIEETKKALLSPYVRKDAEIKALIRAEEDQMPRKLVYAYELYWGDYSTTETSQLKVVRSLTEREAEEAKKCYRNPDDVKKAFVHVETVAPEVLTEGLAAAIREREPIGHQGGLTLYDITEEEAAKLVSEWNEWKKNDDDEKAAVEEEKEDQREQLRLQKESERKHAEENELFIWDAGTIYSSSGSKMLHSLGAVFSERERKISVYTTNYSRYIANANTTYSIKSVLTSENFCFNPNNSNWEIELTQENAQKVIDLLKRFDTKVWPEECGLVRCWECGSYFKPNKNSHDGFDYYCGC